MHRYTIVVNGKSFTLDVRELGADQFRVSVDGRNLDVKLDADRELAEGAITPAIAPSTRPPLHAVDAPVAEQDHSTSPAAAAPVFTMSRPGPLSATLHTLTAPMPGVILSVAVAPGAQVSRGDVLLTLEAMKMRNEIRSPREATITEVLVEAGQSVGFGELLMRFGEPA